MNGKAFCCVMLIAACIAGGCASNGRLEVAEASRDTQRVFRWNWHGEPSSADPALATDQVSIQLLTNTFEGLTRYGADGKPHPAAAERIDISDDRLTYTFFLRKQARWSNGDPVTAHDFVYAWRRVLDPKTAAEYAYQLFCIKGAKAFHSGKGKAADVAVTAPDDHTLRVTLVRPTPYFLDLTAFVTFFPVNRKIVEANSTWAVHAATHVGNGPFRIGSWEHKRKLTLVKNPYYWKAASVKLERVEGTIYDDDNTAMLLFENGDLDYAGYPSFGIPPDAIPTLRAGGRLQTVLAPVTSGLVFNTERPPFTNRHVRRAFALAINRREIAEKVLQSGVPPAYGWVPPALTLKPEGFFREDANTARRLLRQGMRELGLKRFPVVTYSYNEGDANKRVAEALQGQWQKNLGVTVKLSVSEWKVFLQNRDQGYFQLARYAWGADYPDPLNFLEMFADKEHPNNNANWEDPAYASLLEQASAETDANRRSRLLLAAETVLMDEMPVAPIHYGAHVHIINPKLKGYRHNLIGGDDWSGIRIQP